MAQLKTVPTKASVRQYLDSIEDSARRKDAKEFARLARAVTGAKPVMWGESIVGYGRHHYVYASGREGDTAAVGFSARKNALVVYGVINYDENIELLPKLGPHRQGKGCLYIKDLSQLDVTILQEMVDRAYAMRG
ncbi:MAG: DUF1801 domain-containing protein [Thermoleophilaceae bacterium]|nr:DUF1801 domain-containing protein [Thermoleophilaceae bacterium]